ncbi:HNH endonuclease [Corynebacterium jeikeium]|nr:HNH endonuclease [Corynebacterium jeikeium]
MAGPAGVADASVVGEVAVGEVAVGPVGVDQAGGSDATVTPRLTPDSAAHAEPFGKGRGGGVTDGAGGAAGVANAAKTANVMLKDGDRITLVAPERGPVNLYRVKRLASPKQRRMLEAETTRCAWPGCGRPASECQVHHLQEFAKGGETNPENMTLLCAYHNGVNGQRGRGRMVRISGRVTWLPPGSPGCVETPRRGELPSPPRRGEPPGH